MRNILFIIVLLIFNNLPSQENVQKDFTQFVNPFIGTKKMGHTFPGAVVPFGMVQLSPDTDTIGYWDEENDRYNKKVYEYCAGYQYDDPTIVGFSHTHFSGTGHSDLGDFLIMPTKGELQLNPGTADKPEMGYRSAYNKKTEMAEPGYYRVKLDDGSITCELTATERVGFHQYSIPESEDAHIILDLIHGIYNYDDKNIWTFVRVENDTLVTGYRQTSGWARTKTVYFAMVFSKPMKSYGHKKYDESVYRGFYRKFNEEENFPEMAGRKIRAHFDFKIEEHQQLKVKFAISAVSTDGALKNLQAEIPGWNFGKVRQAAKEKWNKELSKIQVETMTTDEKTVFYTALYHAFISPVIYEDVDGQYRGLDQNIHQSDGFTNYTIFSLWDTYRALHPLFNLLQPKRNNDMVFSMLAHFDQSVHPMLPVWSHWSNENWCMIGYHSVSVISDAIEKGNFSGNINRALDACVKTAEYKPYDGLKYYIELGYVPEDKNNSSVSKTLEYAYDDWAIAQIAKKADNEEIYDQFMKRSENYRHVFDPEIGFMRPKLSDGKFRKEFDPLDTHGQGFIEGNAWNYGLYIPQYPEALIELYGGKKKFTKMLDQLFTLQLDDKHIEANEDITRDGIIGLYVHGNEPGHHIPYLYNYAGYPEKTQERVRMICNTMFANTPDGLCGNDDCGQMSAWYVFSALGFYPVCPGSDTYALGSPLVKSAVIDLGNGNTLSISVENQSPQNVHVKSVSLNGEKVRTPFLTYDDLIKGGELVFRMAKL
ncbi:MAG: GH92 family glycosyl hydrolase [Bacteroidales bacterium]|nr:GH92 family glycosyl hydrolase [Bacteroidales bacterium]MCF8402731.1 GH92 family glycosyl hydrolase [Bacteroidales bacterium]